MTRLAGFSDAEAICGLENAYINCAWTFAQIQDALKSNDYAYYVYELSNKIIACLSIKKILDEIEICNIAVDNKHRKKGIATQLINKMQEHNKAKRIFLEVASKNQSAIKLYEKLGFKRIGLRADYYEGDDAVLYSKS